VGVSYERGDPVGGEMRVPGALFLADGARDLVVEGGGQALFVSTRTPQIPESLT
jgi:hypothetical protein